jgi:multidrug efflux system membrane fusion protein
MNNESTEVKVQTPTQTPKPKHSWPMWIGAVLVLLLGAGYLLSQMTGGSTSQSSGKGGGKNSKKGGGGPIPVAADKVTQGNMGVYIEALGTVTPVYTVTVTSRVAGQLMEVDYKEGQMVKKGDLLAVVDPRPYEAVVLQAQGQLQRDQALLANARIDLARYKSALEQHAIPEQQLATQQATVNQDEGTVKLDQGNLDAGAVNVTYTRITSPIDGRVGLRQVDPGNIVQANGTQALAVIAQIAPITVIFTMAEDYISEVVQQMKAGRHLQVEALSRDDTTVLAHGTVLTVDNQIDTTTGTVKVRASFPNTDAKLFPNEFVNAKLLVKTLMQVNIIPSAAIQRNNDIAFVYVIDSTSAVHTRDIKIATTNGMQSAVTGVSPGETVVTDGFDKLQDGLKVRIRQTKSSSGGGAAANTVSQPEPEEQTNQAAEAKGGSHKKKQKDSQQ